MVLGGVGGLPHISAPSYRIVHDFAGHSFHNLQQLAGILACWSAVWLTSLRLYCVGAGNGMDATHGTCDINDNERRRHSLCQMCILPYSSFILRAANVVRPPPNNRKWRSTRVILHSHSSSSSSYLCHFMTLRVEGGEWQGRGVPTLTDFVCVTRVLNLPSNNIFVFGA